MKSREYWWNGISGLGEDVWWCEGRGDAWWVEYKYHDEITSSDSIDIGA